MQLGRRIIIYYGLTEMDLIMMRFMVPHHTTSETSKHCWGWLLRFVTLYYYAKCHLYVLQKGCDFEIKGYFFGYGTLSVGKRVFVVRVCVWVKENCNLQCSANARFDLLSSSGCGPCRIVDQDSTFSWALVCQVGNDTALLSSVFPKCTIAMCSSCQNASHISEHCICKSFAKYDLVGFSILLCLRSIFKLFVQNQKDLLT